MHRFDRMFLRVLIASSMVVSPVWAQTAPCAAVSDYSRDVIYRARRIVVDTDQTAIDMRTSLEVPHLTDSTLVTLVQDTSVCRAALTAVLRLYSTEIRARLTDAVVVSAGSTRYFVGVGTMSRRGPLLFVLDQQFQPYVSF